MPKKILKQTHWCPIHNTMTSFLSRLFTNYTPHDRDMFVSAYNTIHRLESWEFLKHYMMDPENGFYMDSTPELVELMEAIQKDYDTNHSDNHSDSSMNITMRIMHSIAQNDYYK